MKIAELIVRKTVPNVQIIQDIKFRLTGLNLIVDNTSEEFKESGNSVGKSTAIKIIDLCLGARSVNQLYYDSDTRSENLEVKDFLQENRVQAELILVDSKGKEYSIKRDLFSKGKRYILDDKYSEKEFTCELKRLIFNSDEPKPTFRQLITKFVRIDNTSEERMIKFLPMMANNELYDTVYCFLFNIYDEKLLNDKDEIYNKLQECKKVIHTLEKSNSISSLSYLEQSLEVVNLGLEELTAKRGQLSYMEQYRDELDKKRKLSVKVGEIQGEMELIEFEIDNIKQSIANLAKDKADINLSNLSVIYNEAESFIPDLQVKFEEMVDFHNKMIQNRIDFINTQLAERQSLLAEYSDKLQEVLKEKEKITIEVLDEGLLDELNVLNSKIEELSLKKGEITQSIHIIQEQEQKYEELDNQLKTFTNEMKNDGIQEKINQFNVFFTNYCDQLYGEKYFAVYNKNWRKEKSFPLTIGSLNGNLGTGKKKAIIVAFDLAYMQYSIKKGIDAPRFVIHDKMENTHINQLKTIFNICNTIDGQYIIPILRERIDKIDQKYIEKSKILELSSNNKFFKI